MDSSVDPECWVHEPMLWLEDAREHVKEQIRQLCSHADPAEARLHILAKAADHAILATALNRMVKVTLSNPGPPPAFNLILYACTRSNQFYSTTHTTTAQSCCHVHRRRTVRWLPPPSALWPPSPLPILCSPPPLRRFCLLTLAHSEPTRESDRSSHSSGLFLST